jgi:hypothetical protein
LHPAVNREEGDEVMKDEAPKLYEDGVIIDEMELEELEEVVAPGRALLY